MKLIYHGFHKKWEDDYKSLFINVSWANQHLKVISEGSCDTEDWSNYILTYIRVENSYAALGMHNRLLPETFKNVPTPKFWTVVYLFK